MPDATNPRGSRSAGGPKRGGRKKNPTGEKTMTEAADPRSSKSEEGSSPIVLERRRDGKKKYSTGLKSIQVTERHLSQALHRVTKSLENGVETYQAARDESASTSRDGAIVDFIPNVAEGMSSILETLTPLPRDLAKALYPTRTRRMVRNAAGMVGDLFDMRDDEDDDDEDVDDD